MSDDRGTVRIIEGVLNRAYGDNSASSLDRLAATQVLQQLRSLGWLSADEVALLVDAAGGEIKVTEKAAAEKRPLLVVFRDFENDLIVFKAKDSE